MIKVLVVDDEPDLLQISRIFLERNSDISVDTAPLARTAMELMAKRRYDSVVVDYQMPEQDGIEFLKKLRAKGDNIPFILFTGHGREDVAIDALNNGADFYLQKSGEPNVQFAELANMIRKAVAVRDAADNLTRFAAIVQSSEDAIICTDLQGVILSWNKAAEKTYGYLETEVKGKQGSMMFPEDKKDQFTFLVETLRRDAQVHRVESVRRRKDGTEFVMAGTYFPVRDRDGEVVALGTIVRDVTEQKAAAERLRRSEEKYRSLVQSAPSLICRIAKDGRTLFVNDWVKDLTGYGPAEMLDKNWWDLFYPGKLRGQVDEILDEFKRGDVTNHEMRMMDRAGRIRTFLWNSFNVYDARGDLVEINGAGLDVTDRKTAEEGLRESGAFSRAALDALDAKVAVIDRNGTIIAVNGAWEESAASLGMKAGSSSGIASNYLEVTRAGAKANANGAKEALAGIQSVLEGRSDRFELEYSCDAGGHELWFTMHVTPLSKKRGGAVLAHIDDTCRKSLELEFRRSEELYRTIFETTGNPALIIEEDETISLVNSEFERVSGYTKGEVEGKVKWPSMIYSDDLPRVVANREMRKKDPINTPRSYETRIVNKNGETRHGIVTGGLIPGTKRLIASFQDITDLRRDGEALSHANRKQSLLSSITRHDILNQLTVLDGHLQMATESQDQRSGKANLVRACEATGRIKRLLEFAKDYQDLGLAKPGWIDVRRAFSNAMTGLDMHGAQVKVDIEGVEVFSEPMLEKVFYNLMQNSVKHGKRVSKVRISDRDEGRSLVLVYEDNGVGIEPGKKSSIFERGQEGAGGLGLFLAREILAITGLEIRETGTHGEGARFEIAVPPDRHRIPGATR